MEGGGGCETIVARRSWPDRVEWMEAGEERCAGTEVNFVWEGAEEVGLVMVMSNRPWLRNFMSTVADGWSSPSYCRTICRVWASPPNRRGPRETQGEDDEVGEGRSRRMTKRAAWASASGSGSGRGGNSSS